VGSTEVAQCFLVQRFRVPIDEFEGAATEVINRDVPAALRSGGAGRGGRRRTTWINVIVDTKILAAVGRVVERENPGAEAGGLEIDRRHLNAALGADIIAGANAARARSNAVQ